MGQQQSKDELLFEQVNYGNTEGIKQLRRDGAGLEVSNRFIAFSFSAQFHQISDLFGSLKLQWMDREGKTPLIAACLNPSLFNVAQTLLELGANVNAYRPGTIFHNVIGFASCFWIFCSGHYIIIEKEEKHSRFYFTNSLQVGSFSYVYSLQYYLIL